MTNATLYLAQELNRVVSAFQAGNLDVAEQICQQIISDKHESFDALNILAIVQASLGKNDLALTSYDHALTLRPDFADGLYNRGVILFNLKRYSEALVSYDRALSVRPEYAEAHNNRGIILDELGQYEEAVASYDRALSLRPDYAEALNNRSNSLLELLRFNEALAGYDSAISVRPDDAETFNNRGNALMELKRHDEALWSYDRALALRPDYADALYNRSGALKELVRLDEALASYDRALAGRPDHYETLFNRGNVLKELNRFDEALESYDRALSVRPDNADALNNRGNTLKELMRIDEALVCYDRALTTQPGHAESHWNEALSRLLTGDFSRGWTKHEWRWKNERLGLSKRDFLRPLWLGDDAINGKTVLLHSEQGFGDTIQFCRYVPLVAARGARVIFEVQKPLQSLVSNLAGATQVISKGDPLPEFDCHCPLLSLPLAFETQLEMIPSDTPYLRAPLQALTKWETRLGVKRRPRIGLVWSGNPGHTRDRERSIFLRILLPLLDFEATFVSLQKEVRADDAAALKERGDILHFGDDLRDFSDTAALISNLDLVIAVDTSVAHLAGALGKPVWILLPYIPDWRWLLDRDDSPWYPTARLFRQNDTREWDSVIHGVQEALLKFAENRRQ